MRSMVAAAGGAPAVITFTPRGKRPRSASGPFATLMSTVGAALKWVTHSRSTLA
jgi:hypothetical protein